MKFVLILTSLLLFTSLASQAQTTSTEASRSSLTNSNANEIEASPIIGFGSVTGWELGANLAYYRLLPHGFQIGIGGSFAGGHDIESVNGLVSVDYNFSNDLSSSYFIGLLAGYGNELDYWDVDQEYKKSLGIKFGKRFAFAKNSNLAYKPYVTYRQISYSGSNFADSDRNDEINIQILNFSYQF